MELLFLIFFSFLLLVLLVASIGAMWSEWGGDLMDKLFGSFLIFLGIVILELGIICTMSSNFGK